MQFKNAIYMNQACTCFDVDVILDDNTRMPYTFNIGCNDEAPVFQAIKKAFEHNEIRPADYIPPVISKEILAFDIRDKRNKLLADTDKYMTIDYPISEENRNLIKVYRQALREITNQDEFPDNVTWPELPDIIQNN